MPPPDKGLTKDGTTIAETAFRVMFYVALEQYQPEQQRIIHDNLAALMLPGRHRFILSIFRAKPVRDCFLYLIERGFPGMLSGLCRKSYIDDKLLESLNYGIESIVILGAGLDTRAYRLPQVSALPVYEVDLPPMITYKESVLIRLFGSIPSHVKLAPINFDQQSLASVLKSYGYTPEQKTFFIWEGVTQYISSAAVRNVFDFLSTVKPGSRIVFSYILKDFIDGTNTNNLDRLYKRTSQMWKFGFQPSEIGKFIGAYTWTELEDVGAYEYRQRYLEPLGRTTSVMEIERIVYAEK